jgi:hypothetical protein
MNWDIVFKIITGIGAIISFALGILKIIEYNKNRVRLDINVKPKFFWSKISPPMYVKDTKITKFVTDIEIINKGLEPTTILSVEFRFAHPKLQKVELNTNSTNETIIPENSNIFPMRISSNDRKEETLKIIQQDVILEKELKQIRVKLIFKTPHKEIVKEVVFNRDENRLLHQE